ncbi:hypothetical protein DFA_07809 [Cavenderia fasciculata]|uniref:Uncharacterized protein n=1 Tax=Cavenderia fasciculata TaxID=261658 RepID=F4Q3G2_CACFS|nr:uncharacterized protein DFA_07809 [Cavenderia fasciculata]EGG16831.1 hypothetical protein DFA_07809 [Cavenderia fasciculata]|eukprot:XP_004355305.1 hypothetical protein DFA_07809 [Cavenderia fasciculata]
MKSCNMLVATRHGLKNDCIALREIPTRSCVQKTYTRDEGNVADRLYYSISFIFSTTMMIKIVLLVFIVCVARTSLAQCFVSPNSKICAAEGQFCDNLDSVCQIGYFCGANPTSPSGGDQSVMADGQGSFEPIPKTICIKNLKQGDRWYPGDECEPGTYQNTMNNNPTPTCQPIYWASLSQDCQTNTDCQPGLECSPDKKCEPTGLAGDIQCEMDSQCQFGLRCNTSTNLCEKRLKEGEECTLSESACEETLLCVTTNDIDNKKTCIKPFSLTEGNTCDDRFEIFDGQSGLYTGPCQAGLLCPDNTCVKPTWTEPSINCTSDSFCNKYESCICQGGANSTTGQCVPKYITDVSIIQECASLTAELNQCIIDNKCQSPFLEFNQVYSQSCMIKNCASACEIQGKCSVPEFDLPYNCFDADFDYESYGTCSSSSNTILPTFIFISILMIISSLVL